MVSNTTHQDQNSADKQYLEIREDTRDDKCRCTSSLNWEVHDVKETEEEVIETWRCMQCKLIMGTVRFNKIEGGKNV